MSDLFWLTDEQSRDGGRPDQSGQRISTTRIPCCCAPRQREPVNRSIVKANGEY